jgi:hypothetical protein
MMVPLSVNRIDLWGFRSLNFAYVDEGGGPEITCKLLKINGRGERI